MIKAACVINQSSICLENVTGILAFSKVTLISINLGDISPFSSPIIIGDSSEYTHVITFPSLPPPAFGNPNNTLFSPTASTYSLLPSALFPKKSIVLDFLFCANMGRIDLT